MFQQENINIGKLEEYVEHIRQENNELTRKFEEVNGDIENLSNEIKNLNNEIAAKDETIENLKQNINFFITESKKGGVS